MNRYIQIFLFFAVMVLSNCKDEYFPNIDEAEQLLIVDGLLSDESDIIKVRLTNATPFRDHAYSPETGAKVAVSDDGGFNFELTEKTPGYYESNPISFQYGQSYILAIKTKKNRFYKSTPQILYPKTDFAPINSTLTSKTLQTTKNGKLVLKDVNGIEFSTVLDKKADPSPYYRFSNTVMVEYTEKIKYTTPDSLTDIFNCWKKYRPNEYFNLNDSKLNNMSEHVHTLAFSPIDTTYFEIIKEDVWQGFPSAIVWTFYRDIYYYIFTSKKYHLNKDVYNYYQDLNAQLEANNHIFDPISFQVLGNMSCTNDPEEPVLGVFEVSSTSLRTYSFSPYRQDRSVKYNEIYPIVMENLADSGRVYRQYPSFWIFNY